MRRIIIAALVSLGLVLIGSAPASADHADPVGGQFCAADHEGNVEQGENEVWYVCDDYHADGQLRWIEAGADLIPTGDTTEEVVEDLESVVAVPTSVPAGLPETGSGSPLLPIGIIGILLTTAGAGLFWLRRRVLF